MYPYFWLTPYNIKPCFPHISESLVIFYCPLNVINCREENISKRLSSVFVTGCTGKTVEGRHFDVARKHAASTHKPRMADQRTFSPSRWRTVIEAKHALVSAFVSRSLFIVKCLTYSLTTNLSKWSESHLKQTEHNKPLNYKMKFVSNGGTIKFLENKRTFKVLYQFCIHHII